MRRPLFRAGPRVREPQSEVPVPAYSLSGVYPRFLNGKTKSRKKAPAYILLLVVLLRNACSAKGWRGREGRLIKTDNRLALKTGGPYAGIWQTSDIAIHYR